jgi:hypothetical protein
MAGWRPDDVGALRGELKMTIWHAAGEPRLTA